ncbi:MAG TPA: TonB-dependent receptor [Thermoanaerobaculia bacterium]|nr:TonB-dependent receptor [Thermoanaerobaculia bacterium]
MKFNRLIPFIVLFLLIAATAFAQTEGGTLSGKVTSGGSALPGATVTITSPSLEGSRTAITDSAGNYSFTGLPPGSYTVRVELQGLQTSTRLVEVRLTEPARSDAELQVRTGGGQERISEEVTVTGTLIPRPTIEAMSPVSTLEVEDLQAQGTTRLEDFLTNLPQVFAAQNSTISNGASGTATVDLRNLGSARTLVLIDGKRMPAGDRFAIAPDLNFIPAAMVKRVDILTGGASTVYGADAVAGVVNFVLDTDFEGLKAGILGGMYQHNNRNDDAARINSARGFAFPKGSTWDGGQWEAYAAYGVRLGDGRGHGSLYLDYRKTEAVTKDQRDYTNCSVQQNVTARTTLLCGGSSTSPLGRFFTETGDYTLDPSGSGDTFRPWSTARDLFNFATYNFMQRPDERWTAGGFINYEWSPRVEGYASLMLMDDTSDAQIAPSGTFFGTDHINCNNPMLSADQVKKICTDEGFGPNDMATLIPGKRNVEGGPRADLLNHQSYRMVAGFKGDLSDAWSYEVYGLRGQTRVPEQYINDLHLGRIQDALIVDGDRNNPSTWRCRSGNPGCVPYNIFKVGGVTKAAVDYISIPLLTNTDLLTEVVAGTLSADLGKMGMRLPSAAEGISLAVGLSYSNFGIEYITDENNRLGLAAGSGGANPSVIGSYDSKEVYAETLIPIIQNAPGARDLSLELGYRISDYSTTGNQPTYKAQLSYAPNASFKIRGGYNRATRSPNIVDLFEPQSMGLGGSIDPCAGPNPTATAAQCANSGVRPDQYGKVEVSPAGQYNTLEGGNPNLEPEVADTITAGVVFTPSALPNFSLTVDYYDIKLEERIGTLGANQILTTCVQTGDPTLCALVHRDARGTLWLTTDGYITTTNVNAGELRAEGVDLTLGYLRPVGGSSLNLNLIGTYLLTDYTDTVLFQYDCVGLMGNTCGQPSPRWQHLSRIGWETGPVGLSLGWRYIGGVKVDATSSAPALADPASLPGWRAIGSFEHSAHSYFDVSANYNFGQRTRFSLGVNNIADKEPPLGAGFSDVDFGPGFYGMYDPYGRYVHASLTFNIK